MLCNDLQSCLQFSKSAGSDLVRVQVPSSAPAQSLCPLPRGHSFYSFTFYRRLDLISLTVLSSILYSLYIFRRHNDNNSHLTLVKSIPIYRGVFLFVFLIFIIVHFLMATQKAQDAGLWICRIRNG